MNVQSRAATGRTRDIDAAVELLHSLYDAAKAEAISFSSRVEPDSVVDDRDGETICLGADRDFYGMGICMTDRIGQCLLHRAVHARAICVGQSLEIALHLELHVESVPSGDVPRVPFERRLQAQVVQHARSESEREVPHCPKQLINQSAAFCDRQSRSRVGCRPATFDAAELHAQGREHLGHMVVELARQVLPLVLLRRNEPLRKLPQLPLGLFSDRTLFFRPALEGAQAEDSDERNADAEQQRL